MKIGVVGSLGVVGSALCYGFRKLGHEVKEHDLRLDSSLNDVLETSLVFVCVPTPSSKDGSCNTEIVESVVEDLIALGYKGFICLKSTITPGTTEKLLERFDCLNYKLSFVPEFLRERHACHDFTEGHHILVVGTHSDAAFDLIVKAHGHYPKKVVKLTPTEAELSKYFHNVFNALRVVYANGFYDVCAKLGANYTKVKNAVVSQPTHVDAYLDCNDNFRGYAGVCVVPETLVYTESGPKRIDSIKIGDLVYSHAGKLRKVTQVMTRRVDNERLYGIESQGGDQIYMTGEHPVLACKTGRKYRTVNGKLKFSNSNITDIKFDWIEAKDLDKGDYTVLPEFETLNSESEINEDSAYLLGLYAAEGSIENSDDRISNRIAFALHVKEKNLQDDITRIAKTEFNADVSIQMRDGFGCSVRFSSQDAKHMMLEHVGKYADGKKLSATLLQSPKNILARFLLGYLVGDGHFNSRSMTVATISEDLFYDIRQILHVFNIQYTFHISQARRSRDDVYHQKSFYIKVSNKSAYDKLCEIVGYTKEDVELNNSRETSFAIDNISVLPIKMIESFRYTGDVYNLEVEEDNSYVTTGFAVHNCLNKDPKAFAKLAQDLGLNCQIFDVIVDDNKLYPPTVPDGMRPE